MSKLKATYGGTCGDDPLYSIYSEDGKRYGLFRGTYSVFYDVRGRRNQRMRELPAHCIKIRAEIDKAVAKLNTLRMN
jgi:hypothetical protein